MKIQFSNADLQKLQLFLNIRKENVEITRMYSNYLNRMPRFIQKEMVESLAKECNIHPQNAFQVLFSAACGLDTSQKEDRFLEETYILPGLQALNPTVYTGNAYYQNIRFPTASVGKWSFKTESFLPYEPFVRNDPICLPDFREIPQIGYFESEYFFPSVLENGVEWMTITPNEIETMKAPIAEAYGNVMTLGLGLGYYVYHTCAKENVKSVTVIERDSQLIEMFKEHLLPQFPHPEKVSIICADAFDFLQKELPNTKVDYLFADLWHDPSDGLSMYLRLKGMEKLAVNKKPIFSYWIEPTLLSFLRDSVVSEILSEKKSTHLCITSFAQLEELISNQSLQITASNLQNKQ